MSSSGEDNLIARYFRPLAQTPGSFGLLDDAAILDAAGGEIVITTDAIVENVHFLSTDPPDTIARKALRVNLSDLAAKGAAPAGFVLTLALPRLDDRWLAPFARALGEDAVAFQCPLLGGDTVSTTGLLMVSVTAFGRVAVGRMVRRSGARPGDLLAVTGTIGDAVLGLDILKGGRSQQALVSHRGFSSRLIARYRVPEPRTVLTKAIADYAAGAMDVSDGLAGDLAKLCAVSGVSAEVELAKVPLSDPARTAVTMGAVPLQMLVSGGDDYEILCAVSESNWSALAAAARAAGVPIARIGKIVAGTAPPVFRDADGQVVALGRGSYSHF